MNTHAKADLCQNFEESYIPMEKKKKEDLEKTNDLLPMIFHSELHLVFL